MEYGQLYLQKHLFLADIGRIDFTPTTVVLFVRLAIYIEGAYFIETEAFWIEF